MCKRLTGNIVIILFIAYYSSAFSAPINTSRFTTDKEQPALISAADQAYQDAVQNLADNDLKSAEKAFQQVLELDSKSAKAMLGMSEIAFKNNNLPDAGKWIQRAIQAQPDNSDAEASLGRYLVMQGKYKDAEAALKKATSLDVNAVRPRIDLGDIMSSQNRLPEAIDFYQQALSINPEHAGARYALGLAFARQGDSATAINELNKAALLDTENPLPQLALARIYGSANELEKGLQAVDQILLLHPTMIDALFLRGDLLNAKGNWSDAIKAYQAVTKYSPSSALPYLKIAIIAHVADETDLAKENYLKVIELDQKHAIAYNNLASLNLKSQQELEQAETWAGKAIKLNPDVAAFHDTFGSVQQALGNSDAAIKSVQKAVHLSPDNPEFQYHLAVIYYETGNNDKAMGILKNILNTFDNFESKAKVRELISLLESNS